MHIDCETFSRADIFRTGAVRYARDPSTELLMTAWLAEDPDLGDWAGFHDFTAGPAPDDLMSLFADPAVTFAAHNANFEMHIFENCLGIPFDPSRWICTQALALSYGLPSSLADIGYALKFGEDTAKLADGRRLIRKFSIPQPITKAEKARGVTEGRRIRPQEAPADWELFCDYCRRDVVAEMEIHRRLS